jgi:hypothetical protein
MQGLFFEGHRKLSFFESLKCKNKLFLENKVVFVSAISR